MKTRTTYYIMKVSIITLLIFSSLSCKKYLEIDPPSNQIVSDFVFTDDRTATSSVLGFYIQAMNSTNFFLSGGLTLYPSLSSDELVNTTASTTLDPFKTNQLLSTNNLLSTNLWRYGYSFIYHANSCIEGLNDAQGLTPSVKQQLLGEMKFMRAFCNFYMVNLFGDVPLILSTDYRINENLPRTNSTIVYAQIIQDLKDAESLLSTAYPTAGPVRVNKWAATAMLARVYLFQKEWANAEAKSTEVITSGSYNLVANLNNVFLAESKEAIFQFIPVATTINTNDGSYYVPTSTTIVPTYALSNTLINSFESSDQRKSFWTAKNTVNSVVYNYPFKYKVRLGATKTEYVMVLRLAEQHLIRAEARAQLNKITGINSAESDVNVIRNRAGLGVTNGTTQSTMLLAIEKERQLELFSEWGHRWLDLKRTGRIDAVLTANKTGWTPTASLYPIPFNEIQKNPFLTQNPGYQ